MKYIITSRYSFANRRAARKGLPIMSREDFGVIANASDVLRRIHTEWIASGFQHRLSPSVDRIDNLLGYIEGNVQFVTHSANVSKGNSETDRRGHLAGNTKRVRMSREGETVEFENGKLASDYLGLSRTAVAGAIYRGCLVAGWSPEYV